MSTVVKTLYRCDLHSKRSRELCIVCLRCVRHFKLAIVGSISQLELDLYERSLLFFFYISPFSFSVPIRHHFPSFSSLSYFSVKIWCLCNSASFLYKSETIFIINITFPLTARVVGALEMISQSISSIFMCSPLPCGTWRTPGLSIPWCCLTTSFLSALSSSSFHFALRDGFGWTLWTGDMYIPLQFASLYYSQDVFVWSDCPLDLGTDFLVGNMVFVWDA